jgi:DNA-binding transcriptional LysR family regulator
MDLTLLRVFITVATERSFSRAALKLHRTQPAVSQAIARLEDELGERLIDRSERGARLTEAGEVLLRYALRLARLTEEAERAVRELRDLERGRVVVAANEGAVHVLLPIVARFRESHPRLEVDVRRVPARQIPGEVLDGEFDFGVLTFDPEERGLASVLIGRDELVLLTHPEHRLARRTSVRVEDLEGETIIAHNDPSPARERVLRSFERQRANVSIRVSLPSLDAIKRAVEMKVGVALLPRRCAMAELDRGHLTAVRVPRLRLPRDVRLVYREGTTLPHAALAFLAAAEEETATSQISDGRTQIE